MRGVTPAVRTLLNALAVGILLFLLWDVLGGAVQPIEEGLSALTGDQPQGEGGLSPLPRHNPQGAGAGFAGYAALFVVGLGVGLLPLVYYDRFLPKRRS